MLGLVTKTVDRIARRSHSGDDTCVMHFYLPRPKMAINVNFMHRPTDINQHLTLATFRPIAYNCRLVSMFITLSVHLCLQHVCGDAARRAVRHRLILVTLDILKKGDERPLNVIVVTQKLCSK